MKPTTVKLLAYYCGANLQISRLAKRREVADRRHRLAVAIRDGRQMLGGPNHRAHILTCEIPR